MANTKQGEAVGLMLHVVVDFQRIWLWTWLCGSSRNMMALGAKPFLQAGATRVP